MPPESEGVPLSAAEVATLRAWIDQGAKAPPEPVPDDPRQHWAFQPPVRPGIPRSRTPAGRATRSTPSSRGGMRPSGLTPSPPVGRDLWLRRVYLDLIGLPPTREERQAFLADESTNADETMVDRLLADPRHGERWGRHWMDVWRYSDWYGLGEEIRDSQPHIWHWRDWIVESLNADKGYDRMVVEMLAGDELAPDDPATLRATGFLVRNWYIFNRNAWLANTVEHTAKAFLGLTINCARCHDHKYDPISQAEYYRFRAFFEPYQIRIDRVPGQADRTKAGLPRVFDDFLETPTFLFVRGDEASPDKSRPLTPAIPAVLGGEVKIRPVPLPITAACPDKREFVIREALRSAEKAVNQARPPRRGRNGRASEKALAAARPTEGRSSPRMPDHRRRSPGRRCGRALALDGRKRLGRRRGRQVGSRRRGGLEGVSREALKTEAERFRGMVVLGPAKLVAAQRQVALLEARSNRQLASRDVSRARRQLDGLLAAGQRQKDESLRLARAKAAADCRGPRAAGRRGAGRPKAEAASKAPLTTAYTPRPLEFPRAKITYRDTPSNAPYSKISTGRRLALARWIVDRRNPLTARVAVNHVWARHFGEPLVASLFDFGLRTPRPEHHALLDWLAVEFMESGWSLKHLHR